MEKFWRVLGSPFVFVLKKLSWILNSFDNNTNGASARKLSAFFAIVIAAGYCTYKYTTTTTMPTVLVIWLIFGAFCLGLVTAEQIIKFKGDDNNKNNDDTNPPA